VLALSGNNPVTVQDLTGLAAHTMGPFPGGLVRNGMRLALDYSFSTNGIGTGARLVRARIGTGAIRNNWHAGASASSGTDLNGRVNAMLAVLSDVDATHYGSFNANGSFEYNFSRLNPTVDFSAAWSAEIWMRSIGETAVNIAGATWAAGIVTFTATNHTLAVGDKTTVAGVTPSGYNGVYVVSTVPNGNTFTATLASDPGTYTSGGTSSRISNVISQSYSLTLEG
jgi:hypothetical protein